jgi:CRISPR-associated protein Cas1
MSTLFLTQDVSSVRLANGALEIERATPEGADTMRLLLSQIDRVTVIGRPPVSLPALLSVLYAGMPCFFVSSHGRWRGALHSDEDRNAARRLAQYGRAADRKFALGVARPLVAAKIGNQLAVLRRFGRNRPERRGIFHRSPSLERLGKKALKASSLDSLRGTEGAASRTYFEALAGAFPASMPFEDRNRRPPRDPANSLLSFSYALLLGEMEGAVRAHGLDPAIGHLHEDRTRTPSLPLDLMEPFRPACDRFVVKLANLGTLRTGDHFESRDDGGVFLNADGRRAFFPAWEEELERVFTGSDGQSTSLRREIRRAVNIYLGALEGGFHPSFFSLP